MKALALKTLKTIPIFKQSQKRLQRRYDGAVEDYKEVKLHEQGTTAARKFW